MGLRARYETLAIGVLLVACVGHLDDHPERSAPEPRERPAREQAEQDRRRQPAALSPAEAPAASVELAHGLLDEASGSETSRSSAYNAAPKFVAKRQKTMATVSPFVLRLIVSDGPGLRAELVNIDSIPHAFLHNASHQPVRLTLKSSSGKIILPSDSRRVEKRSMAVTPDMYAALTPGETDSLESADFIDDEGTFQLLWGPFHYDELPPGKYRASAEWKSTLDEWTDPETGNCGRKPAVWKGSLKSGEVEFELRAGSGTGR